MWRRRLVEIHSVPWVAQVLWFAAVVLLVCLHLFAHGTGVSKGELPLDDAGTWGVAARSLGTLFTLPTEFHSQPPLYYFLLHFLAKVSSVPWVLRGFSWFCCLLLLQFVLFLADELSLLARVAFCLLFILGGLSDYLATAIRPYGMTALLVAVSSVLLVRVVTEPNRRRVVAYVLATLAMLYSLAFAAPVILAQGLFVVGIGLAQGFRQGWRAMLLRYRNALLAVTLVAMAYVPYVIMALHYQASSYAKAAAPQRSLGSLGWTAYVHTVNEELFRFSSTGRLLLGGLLALGLCVPLCKRSWSGVLWLLMAFVQVTFVWLFVTGRSLLWFQGKYMTPAFIALCWLGALGVQHVFPLLRRGLWLALPFLLGWLVWGEYGKFRAYFASSQPLGFFQSFYRTLSEQPGKKVVFFDLGYDGQHLEYQSRNDRDVTVATMRGRGWASAGNNHLEPGYVSSVIDQTAPITRCYYYVIADPQGPYQSTFVPRLSGLGFAPRPSLRVARRLTPVYCRE